MERTIRDRGALGTSDAEGSVNLRKRPTEDELLIADSQARQTLKPTRTRQTRAKTDFFSASVVTPSPRPSRAGASRTTAKRQKTSVACEKSASKLEPGNITDFRGDVHLGRYRFPSEYPSGYAIVSESTPDCLYICEFCLQHHESEKTWRTHCDFCLMKKPEGRELYKDDVQNGRPETWIIYEIDGAVHPRYCLKLSLLGKLFLSVGEPVDTRCLMFYAMCIKGCTGDHIVGYFTRRKMTTGAASSLTSLVVFPPFQKRGYGGFLISFSYLLCRCEKAAGAPDIPSSTSGVDALERFRKRAIYDYLRAYYDTRSRKAVDIKDASLRTGMSASDVSRLVCNIGQYQYDTVSQKYVAKVTGEHMKKLAGSLRSKHPAVPINFNALLALPFVQMKKNENMN